MAAGSRSITSTRSITKRSLMRRIAALALPLAIVSRHAGCRVRRPEPEPEHGGQGQRGIRQEPGRANPEGEARQPAGRQDGGQGQRPATGPERRLHRQLCRLRLERQEVHAEGGHLHAGDALAVPAGRATAQGPEAGARRPAHRQPRPRRDPARGRVRLAGQPTGRCQGDGHAGVRGGPDQGIRGDGLRWRPAALARRRHPPDGRAARRAPRRR